MHILLTILRLGIMVALVVAIPIAWSVLMMATAFSSEPTAAPYLRVSENHRFLVREDGQSFFWLGDTAWELFHRLGKADAEHYLTTRAQQGFNVVQCVLLASHNGVAVPTPDGHVPLVELDPTRPNEAYFEHVDWVADKAAELGVYLAILPTWGSNVRGQSLFTEASAGRYGQFLGRRYKDCWNVVWVLGGDCGPILTSAEKSILGVSQLQWRQAVMIRRSILTRRHRRTGFLLESQRGRAQADLGWRGCHPDRVQLTFRTHLLWSHRRRHRSVCSLRASVAPTDATKRESPKRGIDYAPPSCLDCREVQPDHESASAPHPNYRREMSFVAAFVIL